MDTRARSTGNGFAPAGAGNVDRRHPIEGGESVSTDGVQHLRDKRGHEEVTFKDVADHFDDFGNRHPEARATLDQLASFLARVEDVDHEHEGEGPALDSPS
jgi:hypothetical protein